MDKHSIPSMLCMYGSRCFSQDDPRWSDMTILCAMGYDAMALAHELFALFLLKSFFSFFFDDQFCIMHKPRCYCVYAGTILWHKGWYDTNMIWYVCNGRCRSLMCTSVISAYWAIVLASLLSCATRAFCWIPHFELIPWLHDPIYLSVCVFPCTSFAFGLLVSLANLWIFSNIIDSC